MKIEIDKSGDWYFFEDYQTGDKLGKYSPLGLFDLMVDFLSKTEYKRFTNNEGFGIFNISNKKANILIKGFLKPL